MCTDLSPWAARELLRVASMLPTAPCSGRTACLERAWGFLCLDGPSPNKLIPLASAVKKFSLKLQLRISRE